jgi:hypothetical protein
LKFIFGGIKHAEPSLNQLWIKIPHNSNNSTEKTDVSLPTSASPRLRADLPLSETTSIEYIAINELHRIQIYDLYPNKRLCRSEFFIFRYSNCYQLAQPHKKRKLQDPLTPDLHGTIPRLFETSESDIWISARLKKKKKKVQIISNQGRRNLIHM